MRNPYVFNSFLGKCETHNVLRICLGKCDTEICLRFLKVRNQYVVQSVSRKFEARMFFLLGKERKPFYFESCCLGKCETHTCLGVMGERKQHLLSCFGKVRNSYLFKRFLGKCEAYLFESFFGKVRNQTFVASFLGERAKPTFV